MKSTQRMIAEYQPAEIAREKPEQSGDGESADGDDDGTGQRGPGAMDDAGEDVAAEQIGPRQESSRGRLVADEEPLRVG